MIASKSNQTGVCEVGFKISFFNHWRLSVGLDHPGAARNPATSGAQLRGTKGGSRVPRPQSMQASSPPCSGKQKKNLSRCLSLLEVLLVVTWLWTPACLRVALIFRQKHLEITADGVEQLLPKPEPSKLVHPAVRGWGRAAPQALGQNQTRPATTAGDNLPREDHSPWLRWLTVDQGSES